MPQGNGTPGSVTKKHQVVPPGLIDALAHSATVNAPVGPVVIGPGGVMVQGETAHGVTCGDGPPPASVIVIVALEYFSPLGSVIVAETCVRVCALADVGKRAKAAKVAKIQKSRILRMVAPLVTLVRCHRQDLKFRVDARRRRAV